MTDVTDRMHQLCSRCNDNLSKPMWLKSGETLHWVACDGLGAVFMGVGFAPGAAPDEPDDVPPAIRNGLLGFVEEVAPVDPQRLSVGDILAWTGEADWNCGVCSGSGEVPSTGECGGCDGQGEVDCGCPDCGDEHQRRCERCGGSGKGEVKEGDTVQCSKCRGMGTGPATEDRIGEICGTTLNCALLARFLQVVDGDCEVWSTGSDTMSRCLHLRGEGWHIVLMVIRSNPTIPAFEAPCPTS